MSESTRVRIDSVDFLRGLVMVLMALDHTRLYFTSVQFGPEDGQRTWLALFLTRWVTHFCAPVFFLLAGLSASLMQSSGRTVADVAGFLWRRGLWLILLELTVVGFAWSFNPGWSLGGVIWALGWSMVVLSVLVRLPVVWVGAFAAITICLHNVCDGVAAASFGSWGWLWTVLCRPGGLRIPFTQTNYFILYSLVPWAGVMALGYALGPVFECTAERRRKVLSGAGIAMIAAFALLRATNLYGNPAKPFTRGSAGVFSIQPTLDATVIAFLNTEKYPASLQYLLMTIGPALVFLALADAWNRDAGPPLLTRWIVTIGRVPMFFYIVHLYLIHLLAIAVGVVSGQPWGWIGWGGSLPVGTPDGYGYGLPVVYLFWALAVGLLLVACTWYADFKRRHREWRWLAYL